MDCTLPGSSIHGILQARILEWVAIPSSREPLAQVIWKCNLKIYFFFFFKFWQMSTGEGNGKLLQYSCLENPMNSMKKQNDRILKEELSRSISALYATGDQWRNNSRKNEETETKWKQHPTVDVIGDGSKVECCEEQYWIETWDVRSMNLANWKWSNRRWQDWISTF